MSENARTRGFARNLEADFASAGYDIESGAGRAGLIARAVAEAKACRKTWVDGRFAPAYSYCPNGLIALSDKGIRVFEEAHPNVLPWNLFKGGPAGQGRYSKNIECTREQRDALVSAHARFAGWIAKAATLPTLARAIGSVVSPRGENSPRTWVSLWVVAEKHPSPHAFQRKIRAVQRRAIGILSAYDGRGCTLRSATLALLRAKSIGKAAVIAVYRSLTGELVKNYSEARNALTELHLCKVQDTTDGVAVHRTAEPAYKKMNIQVYPYVQKSSSGWKRGFLVLSGMRSFHVSPGKRGYWGGAWINGKSVDYSTPAGAVHAALTAWTAQKKLERENKQFFSLLRPVGFTPLVYFSDSREAGNCEAGTAEFMRRAGIPTSRRFVPVTALLPFMGEARVMNTLKVVASKIAQLTA